MFHLKVSQSIDSKTNKQKVCVLETEEKGEKAEESLAHGQGSCPNSTSQRQMGILNPTDK